MALHRRTPWYPRIRWYAVHRVLSRLLLLAVLAVVVITPRVPVPETREPNRAILRVAWGVASVALAAGVAFALRERRKSIRRQYTLSTVGCATALAVALIGYPPQRPPPLPERATPHSGPTPDATR